MNSWTIAIVLLGGLSTLAIFSFLVKENAFYRLFEHLYIGISAGFGIVLPLKNFLWPKILEPMLGLDIVQYPDGTFSKSYDPLWLMYLGPALFGLLFYTVYSRRWNWLAKLVIGLLLGASGGMAFEGFFNYILPQLEGSFKPVLVFGDQGLNWGQSINNFLFVFTLLSVMFYFFFSFRAEGKTQRAVSSAGRWLMMVCFGAYFGSTVMARMALLVERIQFLLTDCKSALIALLSSLGGA